MYFNDLITKSNPHIQPYVLKNTHSGKYDTKLVEDWYRTSGKLDENIGEIAGQASKAIGSALVNAAKKTVLNTARAATVAAALTNPASGLADDAARAAFHSTASVADNVAVNAASKSIPTISTIEIEQAMARGDGAFLSKVQKAVSNGELNVTTASSKVPTPPVKAPAAVVDSVPAASVKAPVASPKVPDAVSTVPTSNAKAPVVSEVPATNKTTSTATSTPVSKTSPWPSIPKFPPFLPFDFGSNDSQPSGPGYVNTDDGGAIDTDDLGTENAQYSDFSSAKVQRLKI